MAPQSQHPVWEQLHNVVILAQRHACQHGVHTMLTALLM